MVQINQLYPKISHGNIDISKWLKSLINGNKHLNIKVIEQALNLISSKDKNNLVQSLEVAAILADLKMDTDSVLIGLLLSSIRNSSITSDQVTENFSNNISLLINGVIKMDAIHGIFGDQKTADLYHAKLDTDIKSDQIRKMLVAMVKDPRVVVIRLAEHLSNLKSCSKSDISLCQQLAHETKLIYAPLANRLGIGQIKWQLEDYAFRYLEPETYKSIAKLLDEKRIDRDNYICDIMADLKDKVDQENITAIVTGRVKHIFGIWRKMQRKNIEFEEVYDIRAVRILTETITDCYAALGLVHSLWQHIPKEFDDYIATPKDNGYQSLHTAVIGPLGKVIEVQIRTHEMHNDSELGVAAHWRYKEGVAHDKSFESKIAWLRQLISWQDELATDLDLIEELQNDITEDRVYVLTPKGDVFDLPEGSTSLDLAYLIHTEVGNKCCGAKVNGKMVQLIYRLANGDQVELLTRSNSQPSRDWLNPNFNFIKTPRARSKVQSWFKKQDFDRNLIDGKEILDKELQRLGIDHVDMEQAVKKLNFKTEDDILAALARGDVKLAQILTAVDIKILDKQSNKLDMSVVPIEEADLRKKQYKASKGINISGIDNLLVSLAGCCKPIPGNSIVGYISQGRGITVHCEDCLDLDKIKSSHPERLIDVNWGEDAKNMDFIVDVFLQSRDRHGLLRDVTGLLSAEKINILNLRTDTDKKGIVHTYMAIEVSSVASLDKLLEKLRVLPNIISADKIRGISS